MTFEPKYLSLLVLSVLAANVWCISIASSATSHKLMVILLDGFRWDYVQKTSLTSFHRLHVLGAHAGYMKNAFPTLSYPNYYSIMTGLNTESHGITGNFMYDITRNESFLIGTNPEQFHSHWWDGGEPLWITATKQDKRSYLYFWPGCEVSIQNTRPAHCRNYEHTTTLDDFHGALQDAVQNLTVGNADLAAIYHEGPDYIGHKFGPDSAELVKELKGIDAELWKLLNQLELIKGKYQIYTLLKDYSQRMKVYKRQELPDKYYYKHGKYVANITCIADLGWVIVQPSASKFPQKDGEDMAGTHGYDNNEVDMRGIFYAYGPYFSPGANVPYIDAIDPYNIMCDILGITPAPNNGTREHLFPLLVSSGSHFVTTVSMLTIVTFSLRLLMDAYYRSVSS